MKFIAIALIAATSAIALRGDKDAAAAPKVGTPETSAEARTSSLKTVLETVATQQSFEKDHAAAHKEAMATAEQECQDKKNGVRMARHRQITEGNQYPPFAVYGGAAKK